VSVGGSSTLPRIIARTATAILLLVAVLVPSAGEVAVAQPPPGAVVPSPGCGTSDAPVETEVRHDLVISGTDRWYLRTVPPVHDGTTPLPLVVDFHGFSEGATIHTAMSEFSGVAIDEGFAVVFPQGQFNPVRWDLDTDVPQNLDVQFVDAMLDALGDDLCLDLSRVYAAGLSYGAWMTWFMNCHRSDVFAAIAPVAGVADFDPCPRSRAVPAVTFHGTDDPILPFDEAAVAARATDNGCDGHTDEDLTDEVILRASTARRARTSSSTSWSAEGTRGPGARSAD
jgi:polyhydroxybutyrate depolymerase